MSGQRAAEYFLMREKRARQQIFLPRSLCARPLSKVLEDQKCVERAKLVCSDPEDMRLWQIPSGAAWCDDCGYVWPNWLPKGFCEGCQCPRPFDPHLQPAPPPLKGKKRSGMMGLMGSADDLVRPDPPATCAVWEPDPETMNRPRDGWAFEWRFGQLRESWFLIENTPWEDIAEEVGVVLAWLEAGCPQNNRAVQLHHKWFSDAGAMERYPDVLPVHGGEV